MDLPLVHSLIFAKHFYYACIRPPSLRCSFLGCFVVSLGAVLRFIEIRIMKFHVTKSINYSVILPFCTLDEIIKRLYTHKYWPRFPGFFLSIGRGSLDFFLFIDWKIGTYRVIHLKCPKRQALRRVKDAFIPPTKFAMWLGRHREIHGIFFSSIGSVLNEIRNIKDEKCFWQFLNTFSLWKNIWNLTEMLNCYW